MTMCHSRAELALALCLNKHHSVCPALAGHTGGAEWVSEENLGQHFQQFHNRNIISEKLFRPPRIGRLDDLSSLETLWISSSLIFPPKYREEA